MSLKTKITQEFRQITQRSLEECLQLYDLIYSLEKTCILPGNELVNHALTLLKSGQAKFEKVFPFIRDYCSKSTQEILDFNEYYNTNFRPE
jgi:hypothetical protein